MADNEVKYRADVVMTTATGIELGHVHFFGPTAERAQMFSMLMCSVHMERGLVINVVSVDCWCDVCEGYHRVTDQLAVDHEKRHADSVYGPETPKRQN